MMTTMTTVETTIVEIAQIGKIHPMTCLSSWYIGVPMKIKDVCINFCLSLLEVDSILN